MLISNLFLVQVYHRPTQLGESCQKTTTEGNYDKEAEKTCMISRHIINAFKSAQMMRTFEDVSFTKAILRSNGL